MRLQQFKLDTLRDSLPKLKSFSVKKKSSITAAIPLQQRGTVWGKTKWEKHKDSAKILNVLSRSRRAVDFVTSLTLKALQESTLYLLAQTKGFN